MKIDTSSPVMVTGSTGYVGGVVVQQLLEAGLTVHCPVRAPNDESKIGHLKKLKGGERLKFFQADLLESGSYLESMKGCSVVFHVASPFSMRVPKGKEEEMLFDPARKGTLNVLESASDPVLDSCVKRVVITSSIVAIVSDGTDCETAVEKTGAMTNEDTWNETCENDVHYQPYPTSKVMAERAAWKYVEDHKDSCSFGLVVCNPSFVMGPGVKVHEGSESYQFVKSPLTDGASKKGCADFGISFVDVRDVARGHVAAGFLPSEAVVGNRYILNGTNSTILGVNRAVAESYPCFPLAESENTPWWMVWLVGPWIGISRKYAWRHIGHKYELDNARSLRDLGLGEYIPLATTMKDMIAQCIENGYITEPEGAKD